MGPIVLELQTLGYNAEHCFYISSIDYRTATSTISRVWLRIRMYLLYPLHFMWNELLSPSSHCVICTNTFYTPLLSTFLRPKTRDSIHLLYDLFPDALVASGKLRDTALIARILRHAVNATFKRSSANVILGHRLKKHIAERLPTNTPNEVIPVGTDCTPFRLDQPTLLDKTSPIKLLYCGNLGYLHDIDTLAAALKSPRLNTLPVSFRFCGNGAGMIQLKATAKDHPATSFSSGLKSGEWTHAMTNHPVGIVTMKPSAETILLPSKTYSAMAAGQAILAICPRESDLADMILEHQCGWVIEPGDIEALLDTLESITNDRTSLHEKRMNAQAAALKHYDAAPVAAQWAKLFERLNLKTCRTQS